jgi:hypothetical protein
LSANVKCPMALTLSPVLYRFKLGQCRATTILEHPSGSGLEDICAAVKFYDVSLCVVRCLASTTESCISMPLAGFIPGPFKFRGDSQSTQVLGWC